MRISEITRRGAFSRITVFVAFVCLSLVLVNSYSAIHVHSSSQDTPVAPDHCLLCLSAHLPVTVHVGPALPGVAFISAVLLVPKPSEQYESIQSFSLYTRPPPQA